MRWEKNGFKKGTLLGIKDALAVPKETAGAVGLLGSPLGPVLATSPLVAAPAGYLLVLGEDGKLALMPATPERAAVIAETARVMGRRCWTMPVLADGRLLLRDEDHVRCLDLRMK